VSTGNKTLHFVAVFSFFIFSRGKSFGCPVKVNNFRPNTASFADEKKKKKQYGGDKNATQLLKVLWNPSQQRGFFYKQLRNFSQKIKIK
jgi:hypothetical protein